LLPIAQKPSKVSKPSPRVPTEALSNDEPTDQDRIDHSHTMGSQTTPFPRGNSFIPGIQLFYLTVQKRPVLEKLMTVMELEDIFKTESNLDSSSPLKQKRQRHPTVSTSHIIEEAFPRRAKSGFRIFMSQQLERRSWSTQNGKWKDRIMSRS